MKLIAVDAPTPAPTYMRSKEDGLEESDGREKAGRETMKLLQRRRTFSPSNCLDLCCNAAILRSFGQKI
jgi:hypothetical protein